MMPDAKHINVVVTFNDFQIYKCWKNASECNQIAVDWHLERRVRVKINTLRLFRAVVNGHTWNPQ